MRYAFIEVAALCTLSLICHQALAKEPLKAPVAPLPAPSPELPLDIGSPDGDSLASVQQAFDLFSWQSFIALNWPATANGAADTSKQIGQPGVEAVVWQHYMESRDIFLPEGAEPSAWGTQSPPPAVCDAPEGALILSQVSKAPTNVLDESGEPFQTGPLIDQNGVYTRFEILTNQPMFEYIVDKQLYSQEGQQAFSSAGQTVDFPFSDPETGQDAAIMLKAAWKVMGAGDAEEQFYLSRAYVYDNPEENAGVTAGCTLQTVGLVGFHIGTKVSGTPQWVWSTFEHVDNVPTQGEAVAKAHYNYYRPDCEDCAAVNTPPPRPWNPADPHTQPSQIERVIPIDAATRTLNARYHELLKGTVWVNYELISTQWPTAPDSPTDPTGVPAPSFLANTTLETYIQGRVKQTSSSCIACHNNATTTSGDFSDFTYLLQRAQAQGEH